jgi:SPP1 gp7 family putative phage head morphogenesis protein
MPTKTIGNQQLDLADDYAKALDILANRSVINTTASLTRALLRTLRDLRRYYAQYVDPDLLATASGDGVIRRPGSYSIADGAAKYKKLIELAQEYMPEPMIKSIERQYKKDFEEAVALGGELGQKLASTVEANADAPFVGASRAAVDAAANTASAYIRGEIESFRDNIARIVTDGIGRGKGPKVLEREIRTALLGAKDPQGLNDRMGLKQRAELIARSELANAYVAAQKASAARNGYAYGRWIATQDERTCVVCASRHGKIYRLDEMVGTLHPRCRCSLSPVSSEAVETNDPELRRELLREDFWEKEREKVWKEFGDSKGWPFDKASKKLEEAVLKPSPSERRLYPGITRAPEPVL